MTALLELKQKLKTFYGEHEFWILPVLKFLLAFALFQGINSSLGFFTKLDNIFLVLILSLICAILPLNAMTVVGCMMIIAHCYAIGIETAGVAILLLLILMMLFLRFTSQDNVALVLTPAAFALRIPAAVPVCSGMLRGPASAVSSSCGIVLYFFIKVVKEKSAVLQGKETKLVQKFQILLDGMIKNQEMLLHILTFIVVIMLVYLISRCSFDYSWRVADAVGAVLYIVMMIFGGMFMNVDVNMGNVILAAAAAFVMGLLIEFTALGADYSRSEMTQFEDDEYVYYVKAVPKSMVAQKEKSIKKISSESSRKTGKDAEKKAVPVEHVIEDNFDFEKQLEESLKDL